MGEAELKQAKNSVCIIGLGYVGLPLCRLFLERGHTVYGIDSSLAKIEKLLNGDSYLSEISGNEILKMFETNRFHVGSSNDVIAHVDAVILCVPTPLDSDRNPDLSFVINATRNLVPYLIAGQLVVLESSTFPGTTEEVLLPILTSTGLVVGQNLFVAYSPERINPGQNTPIQTIPKVVGGVTQICTEHAKLLYESVFDQVVVVSSVKVAELTKLIENIQRFVNISLINELAILCHQMGIDLWEAIYAASTKPYGFMPYYPGPGVGGHCIPVDPIYLVWKSKAYGETIEFVELAEKVNQKMPLYVVQRITDCLPSDKRLEGCQVLIVGIAYKKNVNDVRESAALTVIDELLAKGINVVYHDPYIPSIKIGTNGQLQSVQLSPELIQGKDCVVILTDHSVVNYSLLQEHARIILDTRHVMKKGHQSNIIYM